MTSRKIALLATSQQDVPEHNCQNGISNATERMTTDSKAHRRPKNFLMSHDKPRACREENSNRRAQRVM